jgi:hypothetical protein
MQQLFFQVESDYRAELRKIGRDIPAVADVSVDFTLLPLAQRQTINHLLHTENKFLNYHRSDGVPAHDARTLLMALTREAWCDPTQLGKAWTPSARILLPSAPNRLLSATPPPYFEARELQALHLAYATHTEPVLKLVVDVDERVLLLLALERAEQLEAASTKQGYSLPTLLNKLVALTLPEAETLWTTLQSSCPTPLFGLEESPCDEPYAGPRYLPLTELAKMPTQH